MSIATSVIVRASPSLRILCATISAGALVIGVLLLAGRIGEAGTIIRTALAIASVFLGFLGFYHGARHRKHQHIDISGTGQIRLAEAGSKGPCSAADRPYLKKNAQVVHLLPNSTLWRQMLLLRLRTGSGRIITVPVMSDSVPKDGFRALSVACRWILSQSKSTDLR